MSALLMAASLSACDTAPVPFAANEPATSQYVMQSADHWQLLAARTADELRRTLPASVNTIHLVRDGRTSFSRSFDDLLESELSKRGINLSALPTEHQVSYRAELVQHDHEVPANPFLYTFLGAAGGFGVWVGAAKSMNMDAGAAVPLGALAGAAYDLKRHYMPAPTDTEVVVTTSIATGSIKWYTRADVFYVQREDRYEYEPGPPTPYETFASDGEEHRVFASHGL